VFGVDLAAMSMLPMAAPNPQLAKF